MNLTKRKLLDQLFNVAGYLFWLYIGCETLYHIALPIHQKLCEVPSDSTTE